MANIVDSLESLSHINTAAAETVPLRASRKDVRVIPERRIDSLSEGALESQSTLDFIVVLVLVGNASSIIAAPASAVIRGAGRLHARIVAVARNVAHLADTHVEEIIGKNLVDDLIHHAVNTETDLALSLEGSEVLLRRLTLVIALCKTIGDEELRNSSLVLNQVETILGGIRSGVLVIHEAKECQILKAEITILARSCHRVVSSIVVRILEDGAEVGVQTLGVEGRDPAMGPAGSDKGAELGILEASVRRRRSGSRGCDVDIWGELLLEPHGTGIAGRHEEDEVLEHLLGGHGLENLGDIFVSEDLISGHANDSSVAVIVVEDKDIVILGGLEDLSRAAGGGDASESVLEVLTEASLAM